MEEPLTRYLRARIPDAEDVTVSDLSRIPGGASRETWMFEASWTSAGERTTTPLIVRKDPPASLLDTDREVEYAFYSSFYGTRVPVPRMCWLEADATILGGPFFIMERIVGCENNTRVILAPPYSALQPQLAREMYEILAAIATFDWHGSAIESVCRVPTADSAWRDELEHWEAIIDEEELSPQPVIRATIRWLRAHPPRPAQRVGVVHGDYRVGNFLYRDDGHIHGILDWEMAHLGDPLEDLAWSFNQSWQWARDGRPGGIVERDEAVRIWEAASGLTADAASLRWWELFTDVKCQGIWLKGARAFQEGKTSEIFLALVAYSLVNAQDQSALRAMGKMS